MRSVLSLLCGLPARLACPALRAPHESPLAELHNRALAGWRKARAAPA